MICNFQTNPRFRGQGWGRKLMEAVLAHPQVRRETVELNARPYGELTRALEQTRLEAFYRSFGFEATGRVSLKGTNMRLSPTKRRLTEFWHRTTKGRRAA